MKSKSELEAEALFEKYKKKYIKKLGTKALYDDQLDKVGKKEFGNRWGGIYAVDEQFKTTNNKYFIINTDTKDSSGEHWIAIKLAPKKLYFYDSFSRDAKKITPILLKRFKNRQIIQADQKDTEQMPVDKNGNQTEICGVLCLSWLNVIQELGIRKALKI